MKKLIIPVLLFCGFFSLIAQTNDPQAKTILDQVSKTYNAYKTIQGDFSLAIENPQEGINEARKGKFFIKNEKFKIDMGNERIISDGKTLWTILVDLQEIQISNYDPNEEGNWTPANIFTIYEEGYNYRYIGEVTENGKKMERIDLFPQDKSLPHFKVELTIDKIKKQIVKAKIMDKNGNQYTYSVKNTIANKAIADAFFFVDKSKYPNYEVVDLRE